MQQKTCDEIKPAVVVRNLSFRYKTQEQGQALRNVSVQIEQGQFVVVMGPSGAGKSTLASCLNGLIPNFIRGSYEGTVEIFGKNPAREKVGAMAKVIGLVFQDFEAQLFSTNTRLEIVFGPENFNISREQMEGIIEEIVRLVKLEGMEERQPATLSGGQKQRLAIGSVLAICPQVICMDEPTTDLDPLGKLGIFQLAGELHNRKMTLMVIEHETEEALNADRIIVMNKGEIVADEKPAKLLQQVELFTDVGLMPLQVPFFFQRLCVAREALPLTPAEGLKTFRALQMSVDEQKYLGILQQDQERAACYGEVILSARNVRYAYPDGRQVLKGINLEIKKGEFLAVLGENGSGKTTLVKHFNGLLQPSAGEVLVCGRNVAASTVFEIGKEVGYVFQNPDHQIFSDTVYDEVAFSPRMRGFSQSETQDLVQEALRAVGMEGYERQDPFSLSKGERQRVAVAAVLSAKPQIIILDEPTTGLDYQEQRRMMALVKELNEQGHTIIMITHTMWVVAEYAHRVAVMRDGLVKMDGSAREVFAKEAEMAESYLKAPQIVKLSNMLGQTLLSVEELLQCTVRMGE